MSDAGALSPHPPLSCAAVQHQIASPVDVRRTLTDLLEVGVRDSRREANAVRLNLCRGLLDLLGLRLQRLVDIQYYELPVRPGPPDKMFMLSWQIERDLRLRGGSPRPGELDRGENPNEIVYEFKSGSYLKPEHAWTDEGFILHLNLAYPKP